MSIFTLLGTPATRYDREIDVDSTGVSNTSDVVVWVGLDQEGLEALLQNGRCIADDVISRLQAMVNEGTLNLEREYTVTAGVTMTSAVQVHLVASSEDEAHDKASDMIRDGEGLDDFMDEANVDDVTIDYVEVT